jgi:hypothetical protein
MVVRFECPGCRAALRFDPTTVAPRERCPKCGVEIDVAALDSATTPPPPRLLADATPHEMIAELAKRNLSAVLVYFHPPISGSYTLSDLRGCNVQLVRSADMNEEQLNQTLEALGKFSELRKRTAAESKPADPKLPYDFKGDRLGMELDEFRRRHARKVPGTALELPWCSDPSSTKRNDDLQTEGWYGAAGIVHARLDLPAEDPPTIASVPTQRLLYQFVDGKLFRISVWFENDHFPTICDAMVGKYGRPTRELHNPRQFIWRNDVSSIELTLGNFRPPKPSHVHFEYTELAEMAAQREPQRGADL